MDTFGALVNVDADVSTAAGLDDAVSVAESIARAALVKTVVSVVVLAVTFVIPKSARLRHTVRALVAGVLAWLADAVRIVDTEETSVGINASLGSSTGVSHIGTLINVDATLRSGVVVGGESSANLFVSVALVSRSANAVVFA